MKTKTKREIETEMENVVWQIAFRFGMALGDWRRSHLLHYQTQWLMARSLLRDIRGCRESMKNGILSGLEESAAAAS